MEEPYALSAFTEESHGGWQVGAGQRYRHHRICPTMRWSCGARAPTATPAYYDAQSPALANGYVQATITPVTTSRFALLYRYTDSTHYTGISYDDSKWGWCG